METPEDFICQLCQMVFDNPRDLTVHIRGHNEASSHTCNICSKKLSSASSLDRHMLIHSGERPFQCPMCDMSFTTNGNMNRHMRTHEKGSKDEKLHSDVEKGAWRDDENDTFNWSQLSPAKKAKFESKQSRHNGASSDNDMTCPVCHKTFICRIGFETHMTLHPDMTLSCVFCNISFRNQRGLRMHLYKVHKKAAIGESGIAISEESSTLEKSSGLDDLCFVEFSNKNFPQIAQLWCEENSLGMDGDGRTRTCLKCKKAFPCLSALKLHLSSAHGDNGSQLSTGKVNDSVIKQRNNSREKNTPLDEDVPKSPKDNFMNALSLRPIDLESNHQETDSSPILNDVPSNQANLSSWFDNKFGQSVNTDGLWKGFPVLKFDIATLSGRPQPQSISPLKGEMAGGTPKKPSVEVEIRHNVNNGHGPLSKQQDAEPVTGDIGVGMLTPAEFASANSQIDEDELERERVLTEENGEWDDKFTGKKYSHVCKFCSKSFPFRSTLKVHVRSHMGLTPYKCMLCDYSSADKSTLVRHMRTHSGERPYSCKLCGFPFTTKANCERHVKKRHGKISKLDIDVNILHHPLQRLPEQGQFSSPDTICKVCNRDFKFFRDLQNHMRIHEKSPNKIYACVKCNMNFSKKNQCVRHMLRKHRHLSSSEIQQHVQSLSQKDDKTKVKKDQHVSKKSTNKPQEKEFNTIKDVPFSSQAELSGLPCPVPVYMNTGYQVFSTDVQEEPLDLSLPKDGTCPPLISPDRPSTSDQAGNCEVWPYTLDRVPLNMAGASRYKDPYRKFYSPCLDALVCPHCFRLFKKGSRLKTHIRSHTKERPFRCSMCSAAFTQSASLDEHMIRRHYEEEYSEQNDIQYGITPMQMRLKHRDQPPTSILKHCLQPPEEESKNDIERTLIDGTQLGISPSVPQLLDSNVDLSSVSNMLAATDSNNFQQYMPTHVSRQIFIDNMPIKREAEEMAMDLEDTLSEEGDLIIAEPEKYAALDCQNPKSKAEVEGDEFLSTSRSGKLESRQTCQYCQRKFPWISSLRRHLITHTGLKPYECPHCGATFSTKSNCERHINRRHQGQKGEEDDKEMLKDPFQCRVCENMAFSTRRKLQRHYKEEHPLAIFPKEYMEAPDVIVNNKDLIDKIQQGYDPVLSPSVSGIIPEGTKKRNQLFFGTQSLVKQEPANQDHAGMYEDASPNKQLDQKRDYLETSAPSDTGDVSPFLVKEENGPNGYTTTIEKLDLSSNSLLDSPSGLLLDESFSDKGTSEDDSADISDNDSHISGYQTPISMVGDMSSAASLVIPQITFSTKKGKKARFHCDQCCKKFKTAQTLTRHIKVHQLEHPFKCTDCSATFTTKFNCQRHIMKLHGKSKEDVTTIIGCGKISDAALLKGSTLNQPSPRKIKIAPSPSGIRYSKVNATYVGLGPSVVKILPHIKENQNHKKIKDILPKLQHIGNLKTESTSHLENVGMSAYQNFTLTNGKLKEKQEAKHSGGMSKVDDDTSWEYSSVDASHSDMGNTAIEPVMIEEGVHNSDIIKDLLGIKDSSTMVKLLESAHSAAEILGIHDETKEFEHHPTW